jgi:cob(I)alamin adenosyltransferase
MRFCASGREIRLEQGIKGETLIQVYTGNGKGKTTAALGLALRASGCGLKVYIAQFCKGKKYGELIALKKLKNVKIEQFGRACFINKIPQEIDIKLAKRGLEKIERAIANKEFDLIILDEINIALKLGLLETKTIIRLLKNKPRKLEVVLTGRYAPEEILKSADLISEIKDARHYYKKGVKARRGIEF